VSPVLTYVISTSACALRMKLVDDLRNMGFCRVITAIVLPTVASTMSTGGPYESNATPFWYCHSIVLSTSGVCVACSPSLPGSVARLFTSELFPQVSSEYLTGSGDVVADELLKSSEMITRWVSRMSVTDS